jgi:hypothetical protein
MQAKTHRKITQLVAKTLELDKQLEIRKGRICIEPSVVLTKFVTFPDKRDKKLNTFLPTNWRKNIFYLHFYYMIEKYDSIPALLPFAKKLHAKILKKILKPPFWFGAAPHEIEMYSRNAVKMLIKKEPADKIQGLKDLAFALHFIQDLSQPYHTKLGKLRVEYNHYAYEKFIEKNVKLFEDSIRNGAQKPVQVEDPKEMAKELAWESFTDYTKINFLLNAKMGKREKNQRLVEETKKIMERSGSYSAGMINYCLKQVAIVQKN